MFKLNFHFKNVFLVAVLFLGSLMIWQSYQPSSRYSTIIGNEKIRQKFDCIYNLQTQKEKPADIIILGSSRAGSYFDHRIISRWATEYSGDPLDVHNLNIAGGDVSLSYLFLKEYLEKNSPEIVYVEVYRIKSQLSLLPYVNRAFSSTADWDMTNDLLIDFDDGRRGAFRVADTMRTMVDKTDKHISKVLVNKYPVSVGESKACIRNGMIRNDNYVNEAVARKKFDSLFKRELEVMQENEATAEKRRKKTNLAKRERAIEKYKAALGPNWESQPPSDWEYGTNAAKRQLYYYKKISELASQKNIKIVYFRPYGLNDSEYTTDLIKEHEALFDAEIIYPPFDLMKFAYPYYVDPNHAGIPTHRMFALWLTEDILTRLGKF